MKAGTLKHRVTFQSATLTPDGQGGRTPDWVNPTTVFTAWAEVEYLSGDELIAAAQLTAKSSVRIRLAYRTDVSVKQRVKWVNRGVTHTFEVTAYRPADAMNVELHVFCEEEQT
ncbi:MAG TPA: phage head closure protein [Vicinamibacterales bacterium]|nr:phage head closure protein [Vicinamibacterales bacterium]